MSGSSSTDRHVLVRLVRSTFNEDEVAIRAESVKLSKSGALILNNCCRVIIKRRRWLPHRFEIVCEGARNGSYELPLKDVVLPSWRILKPRWFRQLTAASA